jgi:hypothetical protein
MSKILNLSAHTSEEELQHITSLLLFHFVEQSGGDIQFNLEDAGTTVEFSSKLYHEKVSYYAPNLLAKGASIDSVSRYTFPMPISLPLKDMTIQEKLAVMESIWEDLARPPEAIESPAWHKDILDERRQRLAEGTTRFTDWETAKADIRKKLS